MLKALEKVRKVLSIKLNLKAFTLSVAFIFVFDIIFFSINEQIRELKSVMTHVSNNLGICKSHCLHNGGKFNKKIFFEMLPT